MGLIINLLAIFPFPHCHQIVVPASAISHTVNISIWASGALVMGFCRSGNTFLSCRRLLSVSRMCGLNEGVAMLLCQVPSTAECCYSLTESIQITSKPVRINLRHMVLGLTLWDRRYCEMVGIQLKRASSAMVGRAIVIRSAVINRCFHAVVPQSVYSTGSNSSIIASLSHHHCRISVGAFSH